MAEDLQSVRESRHPADVLSLLPGMIFGLVAAIGLVATYTPMDLDLRWIGPAVLVALGLVGLAVAASWQRPRGSNPEPTDNP